MGLLIDLVWVLGQVQKVENCAPKLAGRACGENPPDGVAHVEAQVEAQV